MTDGQPAIPSTWAMRGSTPRRALSGCRVAERLVQPRVRCTPS